MARVKLLNNKKLFSAGLSLIWSLNASAAIQFVQTSPAILADTVLGAIGPKVSLSIKNTGTSALTSCTAPVMVSTYASQFEVSGATCTSVIAGGTCTGVTVAPKPTYTGAKLGTLQFACGTSTITIQLKYTVNAAATPTPTASPTPTPTPSGPSSLTFFSNTPSYALGTPIYTNSSGVVSSTAVTYSSSPAMPAGLYLSTNYGTISGTPTAQTGITYPHTGSYVVTATSAHGSTSRTLQITILPSGSTASTLVADFRPSEFAPLAAAGLNWIPNPFLADPCGPDRSSSFAIDSSGTRFRQIIKDGCRWMPYGSTTVYNYTRAEVAAASDLNAFKIGKTTTVEWKGYFPQALPTPSRSDRFRFIAPFQIHNSNDYSPMFVFQVDFTSKNIMFVKTSATLPQTTLAEIPIAPYSSFVNTSRTLSLVIKNSSQNAGGLVADGSVRVILDGVTVYSEQNMVTSNSPGQDFAKFGLYDWANVLVNPTNTTRNRSFELVTESFKIYQQ